MFIVETFCLQTASEAAKRRAEAEAQLRQAVHLDTNRSLALDDMQGAGGYIF